MQEKESSSSRNEQNLKVIEWKLKWTVQQSPNQESMLEAREDESQAPVKGAAGLTFWNPGETFQMWDLKKRKQQKNKTLNLTESAWLPAVCPDMWVEKVGEKSETQSNPMSGHGPSLCWSRIYKIPEKWMGTSLTGAPPPSNAGRQARLGQKWGDLLLLYLALLKIKKSQLSVESSWNFLCLFAETGGEKNI